MYALINAAIIWSQAALYAVYQLADIEGRPYSVPAIERRAANNLLTSTRPLDRLCIGTAYRERAAI